MDNDPTPKPFYKSLYFQVITAIVIGVLLGHFYPETGTAMKPLGDGFIKLIKMIIAPIIFCTVVVGIAGMEDMKRVGKTGGYALLYFEIVSTIALVVGLVIVNLVAAGHRHEHRRGDARHQEHRGLHRARARCRARSTSCSTIIPNTVVDAFAKGEMLQVLLFAVMFGFALHRFGGRGTLVFDFIEKTSHVLFVIVGYIMKVAPIGAFGAMAFTIGKYGARLAGVAGQADGHVLRDLPGLHLRRARAHRALPRLLDLEVHQVHQGGAADRARHLVERVGAAAHDGQAREPRRAQVHRGPGGPHRLLVQPRRHLDLPDDGGGVHRPGDQHADDADAADHAAAACCC